MKRQLILGILVAAMGLSVAQAAEESVYGARLMTEQERAAYQNTVRTMATEQERNAYRAEHQLKMQARAKQQGMTLDSDGEPVSQDGKPLRDRDQDRLQDQDRDQTYDRDRKRDRLQDGSGTGGGGMGGGAGGGGR